MRGIALSSPFIVAIAPLFPLCTLCITLRFRWPEAGLHIQPFAWLNCFLRQWAPERQRSIVRDDRVFRLLSSCPRSTTAWDDPTAWTCEFNTRRTFWSQRITALSNSSCLQNVVTNINKRPGAERRSFDCVKVSKDPRNFRAARMPVHQASR